jgi:hypothetical protein
VIDNDVNAPKNLDGSLDSFRRIFKGHVGADCLAAGGIDFINYGPAPVSNTKAGSNNLGTTLSKQSG